MGKKLEIYLNNQESFRAVLDDLEIEIHVGPPPVVSTSGPDVTIIDADNPGDSPDVYAVEAELVYPHATSDFNLVDDLGVPLPGTVIRPRMAAEATEPPPWTVIRPHFGTEGADPPPWTVMMDAANPPDWTPIKPHISNEAADPMDTGDQEERHGR